MEQGKRLRIKQAKHRRIPKPLLIFILSSSFVLLVGGFMFGYLVVLPTQRIGQAAQEIMLNLGQIGADLEGKSLSKLDTYVANIGQQLDLIDAEISHYDFLKEVDVTRGYYLNLETIRLLASKTQSLLEDALPELKLILASAGYQLDESAIETEATDNVASLISELPRVVSLYGELEIKILDLIDTFNQIDPSYIPALGAGTLRTKVIEAQTLTAEFVPLSSQLKQTLSMMPELLGSTGPTSYLIIYQNEKEMRASGGLLSAYGNLVVDKGELVGDISATDMWDLEGYVSWTLGIDVGYRNIYGQNALMNAGCGSTYLRAQDSGIYPDLHESVNIFKDYYDIAHRYNPAKYPAYDHAVILNTFLASDIIRLVEPLSVEGYPDPITADNAAKLIFGETSSAPLDPAIRKDFIGKVATALKAEFEQLSVADFPDIVQVLIRTIQAKNIAFYSKDEKMQAYFDELGLSGRLEKNFAGDYFHLNEAQNCSLKSNFYVYDTVTTNVNIDEAGKISKNVSVEWVNEKVYDPLEPFILSNSVMFRYRAWVRLLAPAGTVFTATDGYEKSLYFYWPVTYFDDVLQKEVSDNVIWFDHRRNSEWDPIKKHTLNVSMNLPDTITYSSDSGYRLLIQKHPGKANERYIFNISQGGSLTSVDFRLDRDKVLTYKDGVVRLENYDARLDQYYELMELIKLDSESQ